MSEEASFALSTMVGEGIVFFPLGGVESGQGAYPNESRPNRG